MIYVTIKNDDEGFYGSASSDEIAKIDHDASVAEYDKQVTEAIRRVFSTEEMKIELEYAPYVGRSIFVTSDDESDDTGEISDCIAEIIGDVYSRGEFWAEKETK